MVAIQAAACAPLVEAFHNGWTDVKPFSSRSSLAEGILTAAPPRAPSILAAVRTSGGAIVAVEESEIADAVARMAKKGVYAEPTSAVAAASLPNLIGRGILAEDEQVVLAVTGHGLKMAT
jgi:threonine synthase